MTLNAGHIGDGIYSTLIFVNCCAGDCAFSQKPWRDDKGYDMAHLFLGASPLYHGCCSQRRKKLHIQGSVGNFFFNMK